MTKQATAVFEVTGWDQTAYDESGPGPLLSRATVRKSFQGDLTGESTAQLLMCQADASDLAAGAGYVATERVSGQLADRTGTFVLQHWGRSIGPTRETGGFVVPGSGTGGLVGLIGEVEIAVGPDGNHSITLRYDFS